MTTVIKFMEQGRPDRVVRHDAHRRYGDDDDVRQMTRFEAGHEVDRRIRQYMREHGTQDYGAAMHDVLADPANAALKRRYQGVG